LKRISDISQYGFEIINFDEQDIKNIFELYNEQQHNSVPDISVLFTAQKYNATVITGDNKLKKMSQKYSLSVHGVLWILAMFVDKKIISEKEAVQALDRMQAKGSRFPVKECEKLKEKWSTDK
jgi:predicted nucleic acid-binding protein